VSSGRLLNSDAALTISLCRQIESLPYIFGWCYVGLWVVHVINLSATGYTFRARIWRNYNVRDKVC